MQQLPMLPAPRPVDPNWRCHGSGDCCTKPAEVLMTREERTVLLRALPQGIKSEWREVNEKFVAVKAQPCPFYIFKECVVYAARPFNCRRFACMRPDPKTEPYEHDTTHYGCKNLTDRLKTSRVARRLYALMQRKAGRWALAHGWTGGEA